MKIITCNKTILFRQDLLIIDFSYHKRLPFYSFILLEFAYRLMFVKL